MRDNAMMLYHSIVTFWFKSRSIPVNWIGGITVFSLVGLSCIGAPEPRDKHQISCYLGSTNQAHYHTSTIGVNTNARFGRQPVDALSPFLKRVSYKLQLQGVKNYIKHRSLYTNHDYGYSVRIPVGQIGLQDPPPSPNHGFSIELSTKPKADIWVGGSYNGAEWASFDEAINSYIGYIKDQGGKNIKVVQKANTHLSRLSAIRFVLQYQADTSGEIMEREIVLAFRKDRKGDDIFYELILTSPSSLHKSYRRVLTELQQGWRLLPLP